MISRRIAHLALDVSIEHRSLFDGELRRPEYLAINPNSMGPALDDDGGLRSLGRRRLPDGSDVRRNNNFLFYYFTPLTVSKFQLNGEIAVAMQIDWNPSNCKNEIVARF